MTRYIHLRNNKVNKIKGKLKIMQNNLRVQNFITDPVGFC